MSHTNPKGIFRINDIKLAGLGMGWLILEYVVEDLKIKHIGSFCYNKSSVVWTYSGSTSTPISAAILLQFLLL